MARPKKENARTITYKLRLNEEENRMLTEASEYASSPKSEVFRAALLDYHQNAGKGLAKKSTRAETPDMCVPCGEGVINIRVGAIILKDKRFLMVRNDLSDYFYSVGGRIRFGETAEEAVVREVLEETGVKLEIDHLGFVQENYFIGDSPAKMGKEIYELGYYFYMKVPEDFEPVCRSITEDGQTEFLEWVSPDEPRTIFPEFFRTELDLTDRSVKHRVKDDRFLIEKMKLRDLQPSQFYISEKKLQDVRQWLDPGDLSGFEPIPVKMLDGIPVMTDGHTRAVAALLSGLERVPLCWDQDEMNWEMYRRCVEECRKQHIFSPADLLERIVSVQEYEEKWDKWCDRMQAEVLAASMKENG